MAWRDPASLRAHLGTIPASDIGALTGGLFEMDVDVTINRAALDYDLLLIVGPVFPHEVVGFSGGNKYLFPGIGGAELLNFFHWLGAVITNPKIIGNKYTPVRRVVDRAAALVHVPKFAFCMVVHEGQLAGLYAGTPEAAWAQAADLSDQLHVDLQGIGRYRTVLPCARRRCTTRSGNAGKCMYKLEPVGADGGELIIYGPHIRGNIGDARPADRAHRLSHPRLFSSASGTASSNEPWGILGPLDTRPRYRQLCRAASNNPASR